MLSAPRRRKPHGATAWLERFGLMRLVPLAFLLCAWACAAPHRDAASELAGLTAGEAQACVIAGPTARLVARDRRTIVVEEGRTLWVSRLEADCPGLDPAVAVAIDSDPGRYCRGDRIRAIEPGRQPGPFCPLEGFAPYRRR